MVKNCRNKIRKKKESLREVLPFLLLVYRKGLENKKARRGARSLFATMKALRFENCPLVSGYIFAEGILRPETLSPRLQSSFISYLKYFGTLEKY